MKQSIVLFLAALAISAHCRPPAVCTPGATRCVGNIAEICDADGGYQTLADCDAVSTQSDASFICAWVEETTSEEPVRGHTCVTAEGDAGGEGAGR